MTIFKNLLYLAVIVVLLFFIIAFIWVRANGKTLIESRASAIFRAPVTVVEVTFAFPLGVHLTDLNISGLLFSTETNVQFSPASLLTGSVELKSAELISPVLTLHLSKDNGIHWVPSEVPGLQGTSAVSSLSKREDKALIRSLSVSDGKVLFPGHGDEGSIDVFILNVGLNAKNVPLCGQPMDTTFELKGTLSGGDVPFSGQLVSAGGMVNWPARNMDAMVSVMNDQNNADLEVRLTSRNNDMIVDGRVKSAKAFQTGHPKDASVGNVLLDAVSASGMGLDLEFSFPTKMDKWELRNIEFSGNLGPSSQTEVSDKK